MYIEIFNKLNEIGLVLNIIGSLIILSSNIFLTNEKIVAIGSSYWGGDKNKITTPPQKALRNQRNTSIVGAFVLLIGFVFQFFA